MFERFSKEARATVVGAQQATLEAGSRITDPRALLVALAEGEGPASRALRSVGADIGVLAAEARAELQAGGLDGAALASLGIDLDTVRRQADAVFGPDALERAGRTPRGHVRFAPDAKKALQLALREAIRLRQRSIHSGHLMLGILRADCPGRALLTRVGVDTDALRLALEEQPSAA